MECDKVKKDIAILTGYAKKIAKGDFSENLPLDLLKSPDELGELSRTLQTITNSFRQENTLLQQKILEKNKQVQAQYRYIVETEKLTSIGNLVAGIAHEINTPLGIGITAVSYMDKITKENKNRLLDGTLTKGNLLHYMEDLDVSISMLTLNLNRAATLVTSFKKVAVDQTSELKASFFLKETLDSVILNLRHEYKNTKHNICNNCPPPLSLHSYPGAFSQIFTNLIMNSLVHGFKEKADGDIYISASLDENLLRITYTDDGIGIPLENTKKVFEPFFTTNRQGGNSGLGLHIIHNIISQKLKGTIRCEMSNGNGVRFVIEIPKNNINL